MNFVVISGRVYREPRLRYTNRGTAWCAFGIGVLKEGAEGMDFYNVVVWGFRAGQVYKEITSREYPVNAIVIGSLSTSEWTDSNNQKRKNVEIRAQEVYVAQSALETIENGARKATQNGEQVVPATKTAGKNAAGETQSGDDVVDATLFESETEILGEEVPF